MVWYFGVVKFDDSKIKRDPKSREIPWKVLI